MRKDIIVFWMERRIRQLEADPINHVALAQAGASYAERRAAEETAAKQADAHKVEMHALQAALKYLKANAPDELPDPE